MNWDFKLNPIKAAPPLTLSDEEKQLMIWLVTDKTVMEISVIMELNYFQVQSMVSRLSTSFRVRGRIGLFRMAFKLGLINPKDL